MLSRRVIILNFVNNDKLRPSAANDISKFPSHPNSNDQVIISIKQIHNQTRKIQIRNKANLMLPSRPEVPSGVVEQRWPSSLLKLFRQLTHLLKLFLARMNAELVPEAAVERRSGHEADLFL